MLHAFLEMALSLLAVLGLLSLGWLLFGRILTPGDHACRAFTVVPTRGDGEGLEQTVKGLLWLRAGEIRRYTVVIADDGLSRDGIALAQRLAQGDEGILLCKIDEITQVVRGSTVGGSQRADNH